MRHLHQHWTTLVTSSLPYMGQSLTQVVTSVIHQLCCNIEHLASYYVNDDSTVTTKLQDLSSVECCLPADYTVTHLEALTFLLQYCLLDTSQQIGFSFNQPFSGAIQTGIPGANPGQIFNNLIHVFTPSPLSPVSFLFFLFVITTQSRDIKFSSLIKLNLSLIFTSRSCLVEKIKRV